MIQFRPVNAAVIRASAWMATTSGDLPPWPDPDDGADSGAGQWRDWLGQLWQNELLAHAVELASPDLADAVRAVCDGRMTAPRRVRRTAESMTGYLLRMTTRATPFGMFAGVAPVRPGARAGVTWGPHHRAAARPDAVWLNAVAGTLETSPDLFGELSVVLNNLSFTRGDTLVIACQPYAQASGEGGPFDVLVKISRPVQLVIEAARAPVSIADLTGKLSAGFPHIAEPVIGQMLAGLVARRVLVPDLWPAMHVTDPAGHLTSYLAGRAGTGGPDALLRELAAVRQDLAGYSRAPATRAGRAHHARAVAMMTAISPTPRQPVTVDLRLDLAVTLPPPVLTEAAAAAAALVRLAPHPRGNPAWQHWHSLYLERYGPWAIVPVTEAVNPDTGIGYPAGFRGSAHQAPPAGNPARDRELLRLAQNAALTGDRELCLNDDAMDRLAARPGIRWVFPHTELRFAVHAPTPQALDHGDFTLVITSATRQAGTSTGRFLHLLDPAEQQAVTESFRHLPTLTAGALTAQISCPPLATRAQNLTRTPPVFPLVPLAEHPGPGGEAITLEDLAVTSDARRLYLISLSTGRVIEPVQLNALEFRASTHPLARFLCELPTALAAPCVPFSWGAAAGLPFLPRVRYRRTILRPATWNITATGLPGRRAPHDRWADSWARLRETYQIPRSVLLGERDMLILLDLDEPAHVATLRTHLDRNGEARLAEGPGDNAYGWIAGRPHEIALPLASAAPPEPPPAMLSRASTPATPRLAHTPGASPWLYARLCAHPGRHIEILTRHLPDLLSSWPGGPPAAWFLRYREPEPHLRIRIPLPSAGDYGAAACRVGTWAASLHRSGLAGDLLLDTYRPETGRYGTGPAMDAALTVFAADSAAAITQLITTLDAHGPHPQALTAASLIDMTSALTGSTSAAMTWIIDHATTDGPATRDLRTQAMQLSDPGTGRAAIAGLPGGSQLLNAWDRRRDALSKYRTHAAGARGPDPDMALASLLHLHHARMIGIDADAERACFRLARSVALSWAAREGASHRP